MPNTKDEDETKQEGMSRINTNSDGRAKERLELEERVLSHSVDILCYGQNIDKTCTDE